MKPNPISRLPAVQFSIRAMLAVVMLIALLIVTFQYAWPRRTVQTIVFVPDVSVELYAPQLDAIAKDSETIIDLAIDERLNGIVVSTQARNIDTAKDEVQQSIRDLPVPTRPVELFGIALDNIHDL